MTDTARVLAGLCFFDDAEPEPMPVMLVPSYWESVKRDLGDMVREAAGQKPRAGNNKPDGR